MRAAPIVCPEESPLLAAIGDNFAVSKSPRRGRRACSPMGRAIASVGDPKGVQGGERKAPLLAPQRENSAEEISLMGPDAPTPAREEGLQPYGALTLFFRWRKKSVQKKASGTATPEAARPASRRGLRSAGAERLDAPNLFGASNRSVPAGRSPRPREAEGRLAPEMAESHEARSQAQAQRRAWPQCIAMWAAFGVAVPLAFFCTLFFRHRKKSVSAPWDGKSHSRAGVGASAPGRKNY